MKPPLFEYHAPESVSEALDLLNTFNGDAKVLAGGQSLMPLVNLRLARPAHLIDINGLADELGALQAWDGGLSIGALVRQRAAERSAMVRERCPLLLEALGLIGHVQIRNRGTIAGSLAHADPAAELPAVATALDADLVVRGSKGERVVKPDEFFVSYLTTALQPDELLCEVRLPAWPAGAGWSFQEVSRRSGDFAMVGLACLVQLGTDATIADARLAYTGAADRPIRAHEAEGQLIGQKPAADLFASAAELAASALDPQADVHASAAYRRHIGKVLTTRALNIAVGRASGGMA